MIVYDCLFYGTEIKRLPGLKRENRLRLLLRLFGLNGSSPSGPRKPKPLKSKHIMKIVGYFSWKI